jgi:hypothetical protein
MLLSVAAGDAGQLLRGDSERSSDSELTDRQLAPEQEPAVTERLLAQRP